MKKMFRIIFNNKFSEFEELKIYKWINENWLDLELHNGMNYAVDISNIIGRTANVDIEIEVK